MLLIECPYCGTRDEVEFHCGGEAHIARPLNPAELDDNEWGNYLFMRTNPQGLQYERWCHGHGCRRWFNVCRDTVSHKILAVYNMGEAAPEITGVDGGRS